MRCGFVVASSLLLGCGESTSGRRLEVPRTLGETLRSEALGCWLLGDAPRRGRVPRTWWLPLRVRLDSAYAPHRNSRAYREAWRLDSLGSRLAKDVEGFALMDHWAADSASDSLAIVTGNGLYGAIMMLSLPRSPHTDTMRGIGQEYGDVEPPPDVPIVPLLGVRVDCRR